MHCTALRQLLFSVRAFGTYIGHQPRRGGVVGGAADTCPAAYYDCLSMAYRLPAVEGKECGERGFKARGFGFGAGFHEDFEQLSAVECGRWEGRVCVFKIM